MVLDGVPEVIEMQINHRWCMFSSFQKASSVLQSIHGFKEGNLLIIHGTADSEYFHKSTFLVAIGLLQMFSKG